MSQIEHVINKISSDEISNIKKELEEGEKMVLEYLTPIYEKFKEEKRIEEQVNKMAQERESKIDDMYE